MSGKFSRAKFMEMLLCLSASLVGASWVASFLDRDEPIRPHLLTSANTQTPAVTSTPEAEVRHVNPLPEAVTTADSPVPPAPGVDARGNVPGKYYVNDDCIGCDLCVAEDPYHFRDDKDTGFYHVYKQPTTPSEEKLCQATMEQCPVEAINTRALERS